MPEDRLSPLQRQILAVLSSFDPPFTLTGGAALAGFHLGHRSTKDLDLFWRKREELGELVSEIRSRLTPRGWDVATIQSGRSFHRLRVSDATETCVIDMVAEPFASLLEPHRVDVDGEILLVDSPHEILVNKLVALLSRSELRDLVDIKALLDMGGDLDRAIDEAPRKDGGFSPLTLAWLIQDFPVERLAKAAGWDTDQTSPLREFHRKLIERLLDRGSPLDR